MYNKLLNKKAKLALVGLGYVGLPIALEFAKKISVIGFDINEERLAKMREKIDPCNELEPKAFENSDIYFTESFSSTSNILTMSSKGKTNIFNGSGLDNEFRNYWITPYSDGSSFVLKKYTGVNYIPMFKISELYLIAAECAQGKAAYDYLNKLRNHRGLSSIAPTDDLAGYIFQEYRREFIGEGQMFFYYKRKAMETIGAENNIAHQDVNAVYNLPIPTVEIDFGNIKN